MRMVDVKDDEYALIHTIKTKGDEVTGVNKLYGKVESCTATRRELKGSGYCERSMFMRLHREIRGHQC